MEFGEMQARALEVRRMYDQLNAQERGVVWGEQELMSGFVGDVGDLQKIVMAKGGLRAMENIDEKLAHELADCLWSVMVLSDKFGIDLAAEFIKTMDELEARIEQDLEA
jgi:NTP pyrophosphatase (non-canonical NTP hydrolase)